MKKRLVIKMLRWCLKMLNKIYQQMYDNELELYEKYDIDKVPSESVHYRRLIICEEVQISLTKCIVFFEDYENPA